MSVFCVFPAVVVVAVLVTAGAAHCEDLDAKKTGPQLFEQTCSSCHRSPAGLAKGQGASGLVDFLRQHYTTGPGQAGQLAAYLLANPGDGRRPRPAATNPSIPDKPEQPSAQRHPAQTAEPVEPPRHGARVSRRHPSELPATTAAPEASVERPAAPTADQAVGRRGRNQRAARHPGEASPAEAARPEGQRAAGRLGTGNKRHPTPGEAKPQSPVAAEAAAPAAVPPPAEPAAAHAPATAEAPATSGRPAQANDQPAFSAPTP